MVRAGGAVLVAGCPGCTSAIFLCCSWCEGLLGCFIGEGAAISEKGDIRNFDLTSGLLDGGDKTGGVPHFPRIENMPGISSGCLTGCNCGYKQEQ